jgi:hypothetical protein
VREAFVVIVAAHGAVAGSYARGGLINPRTDRSWLAYWTRDDSDLWTDIGTTKGLISWGAALANLGSPTGYSSALVLDGDTNLEYLAGYNAIIAGAHKDLNGTRQVLSCDADGTNITVACDAALPSGGLAGTIRSEAERASSLDPAGTLWPNGLAGVSREGSVVPREGAHAYAFGFAGTAEKPWWADDGVLPSLSRLYVGLVFKMLADQTDNTEKGLAGIYADHQNERVICALGAAGAGGLDSSARASVLFRLGGSNWGGFQYESDLSAGDTHLMEWQVDGATAQAKFDNAAMVAKDTVDGNVSNFGTTGIHGGLGARPSTSGDAQSELGKGAVLVGYYVSTSDLIGDADLKDAWADQFPDLSLA